MNALSVLNPKYNEDLVSCLVLHSYRRDQALFQPGYISSRTKGLLWYLDMLDRPNQARAVIVLCKQRLAELQAIDPTSTEHAADLLAEGIELHELAIRTKRIYDNALKDKDAQG